jgi:hypothetical protein
MDSFKTMGEVAAFFKETKRKPGSQVIMTEGPKQSNHTTNQEFKQRGVRVKVTGIYGSRLVTYLKRDEHTPERIKGYKKSKNKNLDLTFGVLKESLVEDGPAIYMEGYNGTIIRGLRKMGYAGRYSVNNKGNGWMVSIRSENSIKRCQSSKELLNYLSGAQTGSQVLLVGVGKRTKSGLSDQFEKAARIDEAPGGFCITRE